MIIVDVKSFKLIADLGLGLATQDRKLAWLCTSKCVKKSLAGKIMRSVS